jgi:hypothetical protein
VPAPKPVVQRTVCSECGLDWDKHSAKPSLADCVKLLKAELARRPNFSFQQLGGGGYTGVTPTPINVHKAG